MPVIVVVADGARPAMLEGDVSATPALARLRAEGGLHTLTSVFPSVTGPAYTPFLLGRHPGPLGVPGLRWYDRTRAACGWPDFARSYVGPEMARIDTDLDHSAPTIFELVPHSVAALSVVQRGLPRERRLAGLTARSALRTAWTHFRGRAERWLELDRRVGARVAERVRRDRPDYVFVAFTGIDKASHALGPDSALAAEALGIVDAFVARVRADAERQGWWRALHLWVVSDHGHSPVHSHDDLAAAVRATGVRTVAHPWSFAPGAQVGVAVSGNAMAHLYLDLPARTRRWWTRLDRRWGGLADLLLARPSVDLLLLPRGPDLCEVRSARGDAVVQRAGNSFHYRCLGGDPLGLGADVTGTAEDTHDALAGSEYPDALVQIIALAGAERSGDVILSAAPGWDFRAHWEPIPHASTHGALHRDHMRVPLLLDRAPIRRPRRTTEVFASALAALGVAAPGGAERAAWVSGPSRPG